MAASSFAFGSKPAMVHGHARRVRSTRCAPLMMTRPSSSVRLLSREVVVMKAAGGATLPRPTKGLDTNAQPINERVAIENPQELGSLCRPGVDDNTIRARFEAMIRDAQNSICAAIEEVDGGAKFRTDQWQRNNQGGGGISKVLQGGRVWEKAGVAVSVVYGEVPVAALKAANPNAKLPAVVTPGMKVPFFAAGISSVMHPWNPHCPTMHFNYRYFETQDVEGLPGQWWFGGGTDITPCYVVPEDLKHFHGTYKQVCDKHDPNYFKRFKADCDEYFLIKHRGERRGMGGIFFEDLHDKPQEKLLEFSRDCAAAVTKAYCPIIRKHQNDAFTPEQKQWQQLRRGRYVEYNLIYDRGTTFGLATGGRVESILMSMPYTASWLYDHQPAPGSPEAEFLDAARTPRDWV